MTESKKGAMLSEIRAKILTLEMELKNDISVPIIASFGFIIALVWRDAIKGVVDEFLIRMGLMDKAYVYNFMSAIIVTIIVIVIMLLVIRFSKKKKEERIEIFSKQIRNQDGIK